MDLWLHNGCNSSIGVARDAVSADAQPRARNKKNWGGSEFMGVSCKCTAEGESAPPRRGGVTFFIAALNLEGLGGIS